MLDSTASHGLSGAIDVRLAGARVCLLAARALWWPQAATVFVADVHLGKAETFRALGVPVPRGPTQATLDRLAKLLAATGASRLVVLGDLLHARQAQARETIGLLQAWRDAHPALQVVLVRGNHDERSGDPPATLGVCVVDEPWRCGPFECRHGPAPDPHRSPPAVGSRRALAMPREHALPRARPARDAYVLSGHLHPVVRLHGRANDALRMSCFWLAAHQGVLPAFGDFTGGAPIARRRGDRVFAIAGADVVEIPAGSGPRPAVS